MRNTKANTAELVNILAEQERGEKWLEEGDNEKAATAFRNVSAALGHFIVFRGWLKGGRRAP